MASVLLLIIGAALFGLLVAWITTSIVLGIAATVMLALICSELFGD